MEIPKEADNIFENNPINKESTVSKKKSESKKKETAKQKDTVTPKEQTNVSSVKKDTVTPKEQTNVSFVKKDRVTPKEQINVSSVKKDTVTPNEQTNVSSVKKDIVTPKEQTNVSSVKKDAATPNEQMNVSSVKKKVTPRKRPASEKKVNAPENAALKIYVTGYPKCITPQTLLEAFTPFCRVKMDNFAVKQSILVCDDAVETDRALAASNIANVHGFFLTIRRYNPKTDDIKFKKEKPRSFIRSKQKNGEIIQPKDIDFAGDFYTQVDTILACVRLTQDEVQRISDLYADVEAALSAQWPGCVAVPFGSITTGLGIKTSDADCFVDIPASFKTPLETFVNKAKRILQQLPHIFAETIAIPRANTPIVKFFHIPTMTNCDLSFKTPLGTQNSKLITFLLHSNPKLIPVAVIIKYWAKIHDLSGMGKLSNYALTMLLIFYLQQPHLYILPTVEWLQREPSFDIIIDHWNTGFMNNRSFLPPCINKTTISELLGGFFHFYSTFNFEELVVCPYLGVAIPKILFIRLDELPDQFARYKHNTKAELTSPLRVTTPLCIQDPFEQSRNVSSAIGGRMAEEMVAFFKFAANIYDKEKANNCQNFLKTILMEEPKIQRKMGHPEFRHNVFSRLFNTVNEAVWKETIRKIVFNIFENILQLQLSKIEEKPNPEAKTEKEKYWTLMHRAVWRRKEVTKLFKQKHCEFIERERMITEEILANDTTPISLEFQVVIIYSQKPRSALITIKFSHGQEALFFEFGRFFTVAMHSWVASLVLFYKKDLLKYKTETPSNDKPDNVNHVGVNLSEDDSDSDDESLNISRSVYICNSNNKDLGAIVERLDVSTPSADDIVTAKSETN